jgi:hypothetical protein
MTFDPEGNTPGLARGAKAEEKIHNMKCRNPNGKCQSITATEIKIEGGQGQRIYRCTECGHPMPVGVGGGVQFL